MAYKAEIVHSCRGRVRMKVPAAKGDETLLEQIRQTVLALPGVTAVSVNANTGSVVMHYDQHTHDVFHQNLDHCCKNHQLDVCREPALSDVDEMARRIETEAQYLAEHSEAARVVVDFCRDVDRQVKIATGNAVDLKVLLPLGLAVGTFVGLGLEAATPIWLTLGLFSLNHFVEMHAHPSDPATSERHTHEHPHKPEPAV
ncbi:MAG TPA: hypothetical protein VEZ90_06795 [Blastocatellia bacterium]|nr:hypothetical protein [Blastocatellia bacterium]